MVACAHPQLGFGLGLRPKHYPYLFEHQPAVDWFEIISENFMDTDGKPTRNLARIQEQYPIVMHGVSLSIGTVDPLNSEYLKKLKALIQRVKPVWVSDHLCWTGVAHKNTHDLLPVPYTEEALKHIVGRIQAVQDFLEMPIALENPSTYLEFKQSCMPEAEFMARMAQDSGCNLLLDVNNVYVTCYNHRLDAKAYLDTLPLERVIQVHLSGHTNYGTHIVDTHDAAVVDEVWGLYQYVVQKAGRIPNTMVEWDGHIPEFPELYAELNKAKAAATTAAKTAAKKAKLYPLPQLGCEQTPQPVEHPVSLAAMQQQMQNAILQGQGVDANVASWVRSKPTFLPQDQLNVYVNAYRYRLYDVVEEDYPVLKVYLGHAAFEDLIWAFVNTNCSTHFNIGRFALQLPGFVEQHRPQDLFAHELCQLETTIAQLADPEETEPLQQKHLQGMTPETLLESKLYFRKALQLMGFAYPVNEYYGLVMQGTEPKKPRRKKNYWVVFRHDDVVWRMELDKAEYHLLVALYNGDAVGNALEGVGNVTPKKLSEYFSRWMRNGMLAAHEYLMETTL